MADRPIIFSRPMVEALLAGRKTQTRRLLQHWLYSADLSGCHWRFASGYKTTKADPPRMEAVRPTSDGAMEIVVAPRRVPARVGDRLWVREAVAAGACAPSKPSHWAPSFWRREQGGPSNPNGLWYAAGNLWPERQIAERGRWVPAIHMPRWASRLTLTVTDVRVQRLHDITEDDARAEGIVRMDFLETGYCIPGLNMVEQRTAVLAYSALWESLHGEGTWNANPWVAVLTFTVDRS